MKKIGILVIALALLFVGVAMADSGNPPRRYPLKREGIRLY